jgi:hypothetical protein
MREGHRCGGKHHAAKRRAPAFAPAPIRFRARLLTSFALPAIACPTSAEVIAWNVG